MQLPFEPADQVFSAASAGDGVVRGETTQSPAIVHGLPVPRGHYLWPADVDGLPAVIYQEAKVIKGLEIEIC